MWALSAFAGAALGAALLLALPAQLSAGGQPAVSILLVVPFVLLLVLIAAMPLINERWWHTHFPDVAFFLGSIIVAYYALGYGRAGGSALVHAGVEYLSFIALVGGLYVVSGGVLVNLRGRANPWTNVAILIFGALLANVVGTTGASVLLIRPFMRLNAGRLRPMHILFFIFIVSNCGGCLTPIGDPPLYLGYLKGVPFQWTMINLWPSWLLTVLPLAAIFVVVDTLYARADKQNAATGEGARDSASDSANDPIAARSGSPVSIRGTTGLICLVLMIAGVFIDPILHSRGLLIGVPMGAMFQIIVAACAYGISSREIYRANEFTFFPVKEVGLLFLGIFATMIPALGYLAAHGPALNITSPTQYYFLTGSLSAVLDNAPTYLNFLQLSLGDAEMNRETIGAKLLVGDGAGVLMAISTGAVFFGAMTYIGNGPNFMVRSIAQSAGVKMPSFVGYALRAMLILLPVLVLHWWLIVRV
ncbi:MAG: sodium:proton antiporter, partial [Phycisphaerales bacterium]|nr:sodium:proton antiporter [Phycisphaerales bacterium]